MAAKVVDVKNDQIKEGMLAIVHDVKAKTTVTLKVVAVNPDYTPGTIRICTWATVINPAGSRPPRPTRGDGPDRYNFLWDSSTISWRLCKVVAMLESWWPSTAEDARFNIQFQEAPPAALPAELEPPILSRVITG